MTGRDGTNVSYGGHVGPWPESTAWRRGLMRGALEAAEADVNEIIHGKSGEDGVETDLL